MKDFVEMVVFLDCALTQRSEKDARHMTVSQKPTPERFANGDLYYLSDGGYSRVFFSLDDLRLHVASESLPKVKEAWGRCKELREDIELEVKNYIDNL